MIDDCIIFLPKTVFFLDCNCIIFSSSYIFAFFYLKSLIPWCHYGRQSQVMVMILPRHVQLAESTSCCPACFLSPTTQTPPHYTSCWYHPFAYLDALCQGFSISLTRAFLKQSSNVKLFLFNPARHSFPSKSI